MENIYRGEELRVAEIVERLTPVAEPPSDEKRSWTKQHTTALNKQIKN